MGNNPHLTEENNQVDYLGSLENPYFVIVHATTGQRFLNFVIDNLLMRYALSFITGAIIGIIIQAFAPHFLYEASTRQDPVGFFLLSLLVGYLDYIFYYTLCEKLFRGFTFGKLITGTRAIREDGNELTFRDAILRSLCRIVPFEMFSAFGGHPWHDKWTKTFVVKK